MIIDENLNDITSDYVDNLEDKNRKLTILNCVYFVCIVALLFSLAMLMSSEKTLNKHNKFLQTQLIQDEQILSLEYAIGYWFINEPKQINDSILYAFLREHNAWYPEILLKQAKIESGNYSSNIYNNTNNLYGMRKVGKRQTTQLKNTYNGYGCYTNWCESVLDRMLWDVFYFKNEKPTEEEYLKAMGIYAEDTSYQTKIL